MLSKLGDIYGIEPYVRESVSLKEKPIWAKGLKPDKLSEKFSSMRVWVSTRDRISHRMIDRIDTVWLKELNFKNKKVVCCSGYRIIGDNDINSFFFFIIKSIFNWSKNQKTEFYKLKNATSCRWVYGSFPINIFSIKFWFFWNF